MATFKDRGILKFPSRVVANTGILLEKLSGVYTFTLDLISLGVLNQITDKSATSIIVAVDNGDGTGSYYRISIDDFLEEIGGSAVQVITAGGPATVSPNTSLVIVNQTVGAPITINLPASVSKRGRVKIVDWKGDAGTNNITVVPNGTEKFNGALSSWVIAGDGASAVFDPYSGAGYAV